MPTQECNLCHGKGYYPDEPVELFLGHKELAKCPVCDGKKVFGDFVSEAASLLHEATFKLKYAINYQPNVDQCSKETFSGNAFLSGSLRRAIYRTIYILHLRGVDNTNIAGMLEIPEEVIVSMLEIVKKHVAEEHRLLKAAS